MQDQRQQRTKIEQKRRKKALILMKKAAVIRGFFAFGSAVIGAKAQAFLLIVRQ